MEPGLPGYTMEGVLRQENRRIVYRARCKADGQIVGIDTLGMEYPDARQVATLRREGLIARQLDDVDGVIRVHGIEPWGSGNLALVTEYLDRTLNDAMTGSGGRLPPSRAVALAREIARILDAVHARGLVHKAIAPHNVLLASDNDTVRLAGFGIASRLERERQGTPVGRGLEGPLPYISPEQTGRMNRELDYRSDFYSLGIVLFQALTGRRPFETGTALEWVHNHISRPPPDPRVFDPEIPAPLAQIVLKLLAKDPADRYQSAHGLAVDLERSAELMARAEGDDQAFQTGTADLPRTFLLPQRLYGRGQEQEALMGLFESAAAGSVELCLVHGYSGVGKSALVNDLDEPLVRAGGMMLQGKFNQFQRGATYAALATAFRSSVRRLLAEPEDRLLEWRDALHQALGANAALMVDLVPDLELVMGPQPDVPELPPAEAQNRFRIVFINFVRVFARPEHPLILFLDDLQWGDPPTLHLIQQLVTARELGHLLVIGAYRSNEVGPGHPLRLVLEDIAARRSVRELAVEPLAREAVAELVSDALRTTPAEARPLVELLYEKARGNPFFTGALLRKLHEDGAIRFVPDEGRWCWDMEAVIQSGLSDDVVEFMVDSLRQLPERTRQVLQLAACIGNTFDLRTLAVIHEATESETGAALHAALKHHTVVPLHNSYRLVEAARAPDGGSDALADINPAYRFQHDRVQQAAYALIDEDRKQAVHLSVGRLILHHATGEQVEDERLIEIVEHLNAGRALIDDPGERLQLARLNLQAGIRARRSAAYEAGREYLLTGEALVPADIRQHAPDLAMDILREAQQAAYLTARFDEADERGEALLQRARTDLERADILASRTRQYATSGRMEASMRTAIEGLGLLGLEFSDDPDRAAVEAERRQVEEGLAGRRIADLVDAPEATDPEVLLAVRLLMEIFPATFLSGSGNVFPYLVMKAVNLALRHGNSPETAFAYAAYGMLLCGELDEPDAGYEYGRLALALNERFDDVTLRSRIIYVYAMFMHHWSNHWSTLTPWFRRGIEAGYQSGDLLYLAYSAQDCVIWDPTLDLETAERQHAENMEIVRECAYRDSLDSGALYLQMQRNLLGRTHGPETLDDGGFSEAECLAGMRERGFMTGIANYHIYKAELAYLYGDPGAAMAHVAEEPRVIRSAMSLPQLVRFYVVAFLTRVAIHPEQPEDECRRIREQLDHGLERMRHWAAHCEANCAHLAALMQAEFDRLKGRHEAALDGYERAIEGAREHGFLRDEAMASEHAARFLLERGLRRAAEGYLRAAHHVYVRWGARRKAAQLAADYPVLRELTPEAASEPGTTGGPSGPMLEAADLDLASVMKAARLISGEIELDRLLRTTMDTLLENAGAQHGCLVRRCDSALEVVLGTPALSHFAAGDDVPASAMVPVADGGRVPLPITVVNQALRTGEAVVLHDAAREGSFTTDPYVARRRPRSVLCVPVRREHFEAVVYVENNLVSGAFTQSRVEVVGLLAAQAAISVENASLYEQVQSYSRTLEEKVAERTSQLETVNRELRSLADRDGLTGAANRRRLDRFLEDTWLHLQREGRALSVILFDVDHFKPFNDHYGHQHGDDCLIAIVEAVRGRLKRPGDLVARYGGEEFAVVLADTDAAGARLVAEDLRRTVEALAITHESSPDRNRVTISIGVGSCVPSPDLTSEHLLKRVDEALYQAKAAGRNRVVTAAPDTAATAAGQGGQPPRDG